MHDFRIQFFFFFLGCFKCGGDGHIARNCPNADSTGGENQSGE